MIEVLAILAILGGGSLFARAAGVKDWVLPAIGYISGLAILIGVGFIQIVFGLPTNPLITLGLTVAIPLVWWLLSNRVKLLFYNALYVLVALTAVIGLVCLFREANLVSWHTDSFKYLRSGALIAGGNYDQASPHDLQWRLLAVPLIHAPANLAGQFYLRSAIPLLAISTVALLVWLCLQGLSPRIGYYRIVTLTTLGALYLISINRFVWHAFYLNGHLLFGAFVLMIAGCGWLMAGHRDRAFDRAPQTLVALQAVALPALVVTRPEGALVALMVILPTLLSPDISPKHRRLLLWAFGGSTVGWHLFLLFANWTDGAKFSLSILGPLALGLAAIASVPVIHLRIFENHSSAILMSAEISLWTALGLAAMTNPAILLESLYATAQNVVFGAGSWGYSIVILAGLVVGLAIMNRAKDLIFLRFPVTAFIPLVFLLAYFRDAPYRIGNGDSLNRMWIQIVPLAILFVVAAIGSQARRFGVGEAGRSIVSRPHGSI